MSSNVNVAGQHQHAENRGSRGPDLHYVNKHLATHCRGVFEYSSQELEQYFEAPIESAIGYIFRDKDILEEALESPRSSRSCVGDSHRDIGITGNDNLAARGRAMMESIIREDCHNLEVTRDKDILYEINLRIGDKNLDRLGQIWGLHLYIRTSITAPYPQTGTGHATKPGKKLTDLLGITKKAAKPEDTKVTIARGTRAVIGALAEDTMTAELGRGKELVKEVMTQWGLRPGLDVNKRHTRVRHF